MYTIGEHGSRTASMNSSIMSDDSSRQDGDASTFSSYTTDEGSRRASLTSSIMTDDSTRRESDDGGVRKEHKKRKKKRKKKHSSRPRNGDGEKKRDRVRPEPEPEIQDYHGEAGGGNMPHDVEAPLEDDEEMDDAAIKESLGMLASMGFQEQARGSSIGLVQEEACGSGIGHQQTKKKGTFKDVILVFKHPVILFFREALFRPSALVSIVFYSCITGAVLFNGSTKISETLRASATTVGFFSSFLGFSLVFRTNICYSRWWEGRCLWGALIFSSINLAHQGKFSIRRRDTYRRLCSLVICFAYACKGQLSDSSIEHDGPLLIEKGIITQFELDAVVARSGWQPYYFLTALRTAIDGDRKARPQEQLLILQSDLMGMDDSLRTLATSIGGLIRVKATGLPLAYDWLFSVVFIIFFAVATLAWAPTMGWYTPILIAVLNFVVHLIIAIGSALEDPFGDDITDLPMGKFCDAITTQVEAIFHDKVLVDAASKWPDAATRKDSIGQELLVRTGTINRRRSTLNRRVNKRHSQ